MTTAVEIRAPAEQTEGTRSQVLRWLKNVGETVGENEPLIEIETDKVTVEVASPGAGVLREIVKGEQEEIAPGELLGRIEAQGAAEARGNAAAAAAAADSAASVRSAASDSGGVPGAYGDAMFRATGGGGADSPSVGGGSAGVAAGEGASLVGGVGATGVTMVAGGRGALGADAGPAGQQHAAASPDNSAAGRLSPAVRRLLSENGLDPTVVRGTGLGGRITVEDVLAAIAAGNAGGSRTSAAAVPANGSGGSRARVPAASADGSGGRGKSAPAGASDAGSAAALTSTSFDVAGGSHRVAHTAVRKRIAEHMVQSLLHTAPHVTTVFEVDMTSVLAHRLKHRGELAKHGVPLTLTAYFLQATVDAIRVVPEANSRWTDTALEVFDSIHIGVATALEEGGLVVPVLRDVQSRDLFATAEGLNDLVTRAREGRLLPADVRGGTFTISNHGVSGSLVATPIIINQPQSAILGVGKLEKRTVVVEEAGEDRVVIRPRCYVTLTIDHRVMDGHQANRFLQTFVTRLTQWA